MYLTLIRNKVDEDTTTSIARTGIKPICITKDPAVTTKEKIYKNYVQLNDKITDESSATVVSCSIRLKI